MSVHVQSKPTAAQGVGELNGLSQAWVDIRVGHHTRTRTSFEKRILISHVQLSEPMFGFLICSQQLCMLAKREGVNFCLMY